MNKNILGKFTLRSFIFAAISLGILAIGKIDYNISLLLIKKESIWAKFFYIFGEQPAYWGLLIGTVILFYGHKKTNKIRYILCSAAGFILTYLFAYLIFIMPIRYIHDLMESQISNIEKIIASVIASLISIYITVAVPRYENKLIKLRRHAIFLILPIITEMLLVSIMKEIWGRPRMRSITSFEEFRYWYEIAGLAYGQEYKSFPSGHTANAFTMIAFYVFAPYIRKLNSTLIFIFAIVWGSLVAISRLVMGAHFLSDVIAGFFISMACIYYFHNLLLEENV